MTTLEQIKNDLENDDIFTMAHQNHNKQPLPDDEWLNTSGEEEVPE
jgi:hypothetical protein